MGIFFGLLEKEKQVLIVFLGYDTSLVWVAPCSGIRWRFGVTDVTSGRKPVFEVTSIHDVVGLLQFVQSMGFLGRPCPLPRPTKLGLLRMVERMTEGWCIDTYYCTIREYNLLMVGIISRSKICVCMEC